MVIRKGEGRLLLMALSILVAALVLPSQLGNIVVEDNRTPLQKYMGVRYDSCLTMDRIGSVAMNHVLPDTYTIEEKGRKYIIYKAGSIQLNPFTEWTLAEEIETGCVYQVQDTSYLPEP